jgi:hypothetical protein
VAHKQKLIAFSAVLIIVSAAMFADGHAQDGTQIQRCERISSPDIAFQAGLCESHAGCRLVMAIHNTCANTTSFLDRLRGRSEDADEPLTNDDVADALTPEDRPSTIRRYVERARETVREAFGGAPAQQVTSADGSYYEGSFDANRTGVGVAIRRDGGVARGQFDNGRLSGAGQTIEPSGAMAAGAFRENELSGDGATQNTDGEVLAGTFDNGHPVGAMEASYPDGSTQRVLYDDSGNELARGPRAPPGQQAAAPDDPRLIQPAPNGGVAEIRAIPCSTERADLADRGGNPNSFRDEVIAGGLNTASTDALRTSLDGFMRNPPRDAGERYERCLYQERLRELEASMTPFAATIDVGHCQSMRAAALPELGVTDEQRRVTEESMAQSIAAATPAQLAETYQALEPEPNLPSDHRASDQYAQCLAAERLRQLDPNVDLATVRRGEYIPPGAAPAGPDPWAAALSRNGGDAGSAMLAQSADAAARAARQRDNAVLAERSRQRVGERRNEFWSTVLQVATVAAQTYVASEAAQAQADAQAAQAMAQAQAQAAAQARASQQAQRCVSTITDRWGNRFDAVDHYPCFASSAPAQSQAQTQAPARQTTAPASQQCQGSATTYVDNQGFRLSCGTAN